MKKSIETSVISKRYLFILSAILSILLIAGGFFYYKYNIRYIKKNSEDELKAIAELKTSQVTNWLNERYADAEVISQSPFLIETVDTWLKNSGNDKLRNGIIEQLILPQKSYNYEAIFLASVNGEVLLSAGSDLRYFDAYTGKLVTEAVKENKIIFTGFYYCSTENKVHFDMMAPLLKNKEIIAVLVLRRNPYRFIYPLIQSWPMPDKTAETLLIKQDGDSVLFLNELRHQKNTALKFRLPMSDDLPAAQAINGKTGIFEGKDYRGIEVLSWLSPIQGTDWYMVAKVDKAEILSELKFRAITIVVIVSGLILIIFAGVNILYHSKQKSIYQQLYTREKDLGKLNARFKAILESVPDIIMETDKNKIYKWTNKAGQHFFGENVIGKEASFYFEGEQETYAAVEPLFKGTTEDIIYVESWQRRYDGEKRLLAWWCRSLRDEDGNITGALSAAQDITDRKHTEEALRESEERFRGTFEQAAVGIAHVSLGGKFMRLNRRFCDIVGYSHEEMLKLTFQEITHPDDLQADLEYVRQMLAKEIQTYSMEKRYIRKDGGLVWINLTASLVSDPLGQPKFFIAVVEDITKRKQAEEALRRSLEREKFLGDLIRNASIAVGVGFPDGRLGMCNLAFQELTGYSEEDLKNVSWNTVLTPPEWLEIEMKYLAELDRTKQPISYEKEYIHKTGKRIPVELVVHPFFDTDGTVTHYFGFITDISERKKAEKELRRSAALLRETGRIARVGGWELDVATMKQKWTDETYAIHDQDPNKYIPDSALEIGRFEPGSGELIANAFKNAITKGIPYDLELEMTTVKGNRKWVRAVCKPLSENGNVVRLSGTIQDITERKQAEIELKKYHDHLEELVGERTKQLIAANNELESFSYSVSHDLRAPLRAIDGFTVKLVDEYNTKFDEEGKRIVSVITRNTRKMGQLIDDLLAFSRLSRKELDVTRVNMQQLFDECWNELISLHPERQITLKNNNLPVAWADLSTIKQVVLNLISNALKFTGNKEMPLIETGYFKKDNYDVFYIKDNGVGFDMKYSAKLFNVFQRLHSETEFPGTGVGLAIVHRIVQRHGGEVWAEAVKNEGATFYFTLPKKGGTK